MFAVALLIFTSILVADWGSMVLKVPLILEVMSLFILNIGMKMLPAID